MIRFRPFLALTAVAALVAATVVQSDARPRGSFGSRGSQTYSAPPSTATAPNTARPIERSTTQPGQPGQPSAARPATQTAGGGFFNRPGLLGGLAAGFLGAGLLGLLFGQGLFGNLGGLASFLGLVLQLGLVALVGYFIWNMWKRRSQPQPAYAGMGSRMPRQAEPEPESQRSPMNFSGLSSGLGGAAASRGGFGRNAVEPITITPEDFDEFERLLGEVLTAYGRHDVAALRERLTPEMLSYFSEQLSQSASRGLENHISDVKLLQGDLAEAWREGDREYATVAMRYSLKDKVIDRNTGRVVEGGDEPQEVTEVWTFTRAAGGKWLLSAIQQVD
jgi:predicted lipid-binding transport protein (Tim44 family)